MEGVVVVEKEDEEGVKGVEGVEGWRRKVLPWIGARAQQHRGP